jgi:heterodisulfide reductase subunit B
MKYGYYPGCSLEGISVEYDKSIRVLFDRLGIEMEDLPDWICCGTVAAPSMSRLLGLATPLLSMAQAKQADFDKLITPCSACLYHFKNAIKQVEGDAALRSEIEAVLDYSLEDTPPSIHPLELLYTEEFKPRFKELLSPERDLSDLKVVCYYGCHISRPAEVMEFDDPEDPQSMDHLLEWVGVQVLDWECKGDCCGAHFSLIRPDIVVDLCQPIFEAALEVKADAIIVACPMCHANLDTRQEEIAARIGNSINLPILYFSQVLGYAIGLESKEVGFNKHIVDPVPLMLAKCKQRSGEMNVLVSA